MVVKVLQDVLARVETWPPERQEQAAEMLAELEESGNRWEHTDEQVAEIRRRLEDRSEPMFTLEEVDARLRTLLE